MLKKSEPAREMIIYRHWINRGMVWFRLHVLAVCQKPAHSLQLFKAWWTGNCSSLINTALFVALLGKSMISLVCWKNGNLSSSQSAAGFGSSNLHSVWKQHSWKMGEREVVVHPLGVAVDSNKAAWLLAAPRLVSPNLWFLLHSVSAALTERYSQSGQQYRELGCCTPSSCITLQMVNAWRGTSLLCLKGPTRKLVCIACGSAIRHHTRSGKMYVC